MKFKQRPIASAVALALAGTALPALAQQTPRPAVTETAMTERPDLHSPCISTPPTLPTLPTPRRRAMNRLRAGLT